MPSLAPSPPAAPLPISRAEAAGELLRRRRARVGLLDFVRYTKPDYEANWHHELLGAYLQRWSAGTCKRLIVSMPPQHGKSELVSRRLPAWLLGRQPDARVVVCAYGASLAADLNRDVQRVIDDDPYRRLFPDTQLTGHNVRTASGPEALRNADVFEVVGYRGSLRAAGVGGPITGKPMDFGIVDDPIKNREEADSPAVREQLWRWYTGAFLSRVHGDTAILVCMTRWHPADLVGRLLKLQAEDPKADQWEVLTLPAVAKETRPAGDPRQPGEVLWPARHPPAELEAHKAASLTDWHSLYQQEPRAEGALEWPDEYFNGPGFWFDEWPVECEVKVLALDPSKGADARHSDFQALVLYGRTKDGIEWVEADMARRPMTAARGPDGARLTEGMVEAAVDWFARVRAETLAVEVNQFQQLLLVPVRDYAALARVDVRITQLDNRINKNIRIRRLGEPLARRRLRFRRTPGTRLLVEQLQEFPTGDHDDGPDALEMARRTAVEIVNGRMAGGGQQRLRA